MEKKYAECLKHGDLVICNGKRGTVNYINISDKQAYVEMTVIVEDKNLPFPYVARVERVGGWCGYRELKFGGNAAAVRARYLKKQKAARSREAKMQKVYAQRDKEIHSEWKKNEEGERRHKATLFDFEFLEREKLLADTMGTSAYGYPWGTCATCGKEGGMVPYKGKLFCRMCLCADDPDTPKQVLVRSNFGQTVDITGGRVGGGHFHGMNSEWLAARIDWADEVIGGIQRYELSPERKKKLKEALLAWAVQQPVADLHSAKAGIRRQLVLEMHAAKNRTGLKKRKYRGRHGHHDASREAAS
jgi:hypothetical protein